MAKPDVQNRWDDGREGSEVKDEPSSDFGADSVRAYLRDMGRLRLLTREEEVDLAKQVEEGERAVLGAVLKSALGVGEILRLGAALRARAIRPGAIALHSNRPDENLDQKVGQRKLPRFVAPVARPAKRPRTSFRS